ncbi:Uncharacterised protein [Mycobacteroides abscessus]|nr:Uncharacterised protein [Mycobacteroides abscessus]
MRDAEAIAERVAQALGDESTFFNGLTHGLAADADSASVGFTSVLWPEFDFEATRDANGVVQSARHRRARGRAPEADSPEDLLSWSVSVQEFADRFGPATLNYSSAFSEKYCGRTSTTSSSGTRTRQFPHRRDCYRQQG